MANAIPEISPTEVKRKMEANESFVLLDVREPSEYQLCRIPGSRLIPLAEVPRRLKELNSDDEIVVHCKSGMRSAKAVDVLMRSGFQRVYNLKGGILAWSDQVDPSVPKY